MRNLCKKQALRLIRYVLFTTIKSAKIIFIRVIRVQIVGFNAAKKIIKNQCAINYYQKKIPI
jgi:hypothetical protein